MGSRGGRGQLIREEVRVLSSLPLCTHRVVYFCIHGTVRTARFCLDKRHAGAWCIEGGGRGYFVEARNHNASVVMKTKTPKEANFSFVQSYPLAGGNLP